MAAPAPAAVVPLAVAMIAPVAAVVMTVPEAVGAMVVRAAADVMTGPERVPMVVRVGVDETNGLAEVPMADVTIEAAGPVATEDGLVAAGQVVAAVRGVVATSSPRSGAPMMARSPTPSVVLPKSMPAEARPV